MIERTRREVHARLTYEINYWDGQYARLREQERAGKQTRLASSVARQRADDLADRLRSRTRELDLEAQVQALPPVVVGGAIVVPQGLLDRLAGTARVRSSSCSPARRRRIERARHGRGHGR